MTPDKRPVIRFPPGTLAKWDREVNENPIPNDDPQPTILAGTGGRPATRKELLAFLAEHKARIAREHPDW